MISVVSPVYKAANIIEKLVSELEAALQQLDLPYEIILVEDCGGDNSWEVIQKICKENEHVKGVKLSRNFGQYPATLAGLSLAKGDWMVVIDCDLQDQPKEIIKLYEKAREGYDVVVARRVTRQDGFIKRLSSKSYSIVFKFLTNVERDRELSNFGIYSRKVIEQMFLMKDKVQFFPLFINWLGFDRATVEVEHANRYEGRSSYSYKKLFNLAFNTIITFSNKPLKLFVIFGIIVSFLSAIFGVYSIIDSVRGDVPILGYSSIIVSICFFSGIIMTMLGVCGIYIGKVFDQAKDRPIYIIDKNTMDNKRKLL